MPDSLPSPVEALSFRWEWRPYQARVLAAVERHLRDDRLHVVAAPGAGKTTLGLEVVRRLGRPALVLAPTLTIRNQWIEQLGDFLPPGSAAAWTSRWASRDLRSPSFFTAATYQALLALVREGPEGEEVEEGEGDAEGAAGAGDADAPTETEAATLVARLRRAGVGTLVLDEAHHLKQEWWKALDAVARGLDGLTLLSLTATPPYDATGHEWRRYEALCGPVDEEIAVPELVRVGTLCPHQDFVHAVTVPPSEAAEVRAFDQAASEIFSRLVDDPRFQAQVDAHPWVAMDDLDHDAVLDRPEVAVALLAYLRASQASLPPTLLGALDLEGTDVPLLDRARLQVLLAELLFGASFVEVDADYRRELAATLLERGLLWRRRLRLVDDERTERTLALSAAKIRGCVEIHRAERAARGDGLRQVVLTDYIRDEALGAGDAATEAAPDLGAFPVFDALRRSDVALLSGRLTVIHAQHAQRLRAAAGHPPDLRLTELPDRPGWLRVEGVGTGRLVPACTRLLEEGALRVLVGTRSLLGEGWDAPCVNSIVLASFVGAFVSTNQMRGRAIRTDPADPGKVASVWHLAALAPDTPTGFLDLRRLGERFETFVGLSRDGTSIESGIERLGLPPLSDAADVEAFDAEERRRLGRLPEVADGWRRAIEGADAGRVVPTVVARRPPTLRPLHLTRTLRYVLYETGWASVLALGEVVRRMPWDGSGLTGTALLVAAAVPMVALAPRLWRAARLAVLHAPVDGSVYRIGRAVLEALGEIGLVEGEDLSVRTARGPDGSVDISLAGGTFYEQSLFADAMGEILGPIANPRYLITRPVSGLLGTRVDYHAVPTLLGDKRAHADALHRAWLHHVGPGELVYTRREGGRRALLAARGRAFSARFVDPLERLDRWQ